MRVAPLLLVACGTADPEIRGGSAAERALVAELFAAFVDATPDWPIRLSHIAIAEVRGGARGRYSPVDRSIHLDPGAVADTLPHELCHALDLQHGDAVDDEAGWFFADPQSEPVYDGRLERLEAFAYTCQIGQETTWLVGEPCGGDLPGTHTLAELQAIYRPPDDLIDGWRWTEVGSRVLPGAGDDGFDVAGTEDGTLALDLPDGARLYLDPWTGQRVGFSFDLPPEGGSTPVGALSLGHAAAEGTEIFRFLVPVPNGGLADRLAIRTPEGRARLGCSRDWERPFVVDGAPWSAWADGDVVRWGRWTRE